jgi:hypothetical protein
LGAKLSSLLGGVAELPPVEGQGQRYEKTISQADTVARVSEVNSVPEDITAPQTTLLDGTVPAGTWKRRNFGASTYCSNHREFKGLHRKGGRKKLRDFS